MTVFTLVKDLIGKEDINWGDSSQTFARPTHTGGSTDITYIDAEVIPSTTLGGYIGDHLHRQNTDTGTDSVTFRIYTGGNGVTLDASGLTAPRKFTFPDTGNQELVGATDLASTEEGYGASKVGVEDAGNYYDNSTVEAVLQEAGASIAANTLAANKSGFRRGFKLVWSSATRIAIMSGIWHHQGSTNQLVYTDSTINFDVGPAGSNPSSSTGSSELQYLYIDDSAVNAAGTQELTASEFINSSNVPGWDATRKGWYYGLDRCIGAFYLDSTTAIKKFATYEADDHYQYLEIHSALCTSAPVIGAMNTGASVDFSATAPVFADKVELAIYTPGTTQPTSWHFNFDGTNTADQMYIQNISCPAGSENTGVTTSGTLGVDSDRRSYFMGTWQAETTFWHTGYFYGRL